MKAYLLCHGVSFYSSLLIVMASVYQFIQIGMFTHEIIAHGEFQNIYYVYIRGQIKS